MARLLRWFGSLLTSFRSCIKDTDNIKQTIEEDEFSGIYFWEDVVKNQKYKIKNKKRGGDGEAFSKEPEIHFQQASTETSSQSALTEIQFAEIITEDIAISPKESSNDDEDSDDNQIYLHNILMAVELPEIDSSDEEPTEMYTSQTPEESKIPIDHEISQTEKGTTKVEAPISEVPNALISVQNASTNSEDKDIPTTSEEQTSSSNEADSQSSEEFNAMDMWLEAEELPPPNSPLLMKKNRGGTDFAPPDILVIVQEQQFRAHQKILKLNSVYFEQRLAGKKNTHCVVNIQSKRVGPEAFNSILQFIYNKTFSTCENMPQLIQAALYLETEIVVKKLEWILNVKEKNIKNAIYLYATAWEWKAQLQNAKSQESADISFKQVVIKNQYLDLTEEQQHLLCDSQFSILESVSETIGQEDIFDQVALKPKIIVWDEEPLTLWVLDTSKTNFNKAIYLDAETWESSLQEKINQSMEILALNFEDVVKQNYYLQLKKTEIQMLLNTDVLNARSELIVFLAALKWIDHDYLQREEFAVDIFSCVRFSQMTVEEILSCYHPPVLMGLIELPAVQDMLHKALQYIAAKTINQERLFKASKPRTLLLKDKPLTLWEMGAYIPDLRLESQSESSTESSNSSQENTSSQLCSTKKTHLSRFIDLFEDDL